MSVHTVFFDVFGTLMPYKNLPREVILAKRARLAGLSITEEQMKGALATLTTQNMGFAMAGQLANEDVPRDRTYWERTFGNVLIAAGVTGDVRPYAIRMCDSFLETEDYYIDPEALPTLEGLRKQGFNVGVISNAPKGLAKTLDKYGILPHLVIAVGSQDIGIEKPDPRIFRYALELTHLAAGDCAYVGDEYMTDARAAQAAGLLGVYFDRSGTREAQDLPTIHHLSDLLGPGSPLRNGR